MKKNDGFVSYSEYDGKEFQGKIKEAVGKGELNAYVRHPQTGVPIKIPKELAMRIAKGEAISWDELLRYKDMN